MFNRKGADSTGDILSCCNPPEPRYECPICIHWLNEPVLTSCGHRFCKSCIESWLRDQSKCCPLDNKELSLGSDIFPDNFTRREIAQIKSDCPNSNLGCKVSTSPLEMDEHVLECSFRQKVNIYECPFSRLNCKYKSNSQSDLNDHIKKAMHEHLNILLGVFNRHLLNPVMNKMWDPPQKSNIFPEVQRSEADESLIKAMYERIVVLEQKSREQESKIDKLTRELSTMCKTSEVEAKYSNGIILWRLDQFSKKVEMMAGNPNTRFYSSYTYTSPFGYKFCARMNIPPKTKECLSLHVHMMQSENDYHLDWPFKGRIKISMIHPRDQLKSQHDTIMSKPEILAFHRPMEDISPRGFGFLEYANITGIFSKGFVDNDNLIIKIQMNIV